jgi:putative ABC transport system substrate-binding protein
VKRREFIKLMAGAATPWPLTVRAQQPARDIPRVGFLALPNAGVEEVRQGLAELGYIEGQNISFDIIPLEERIDRLTEFARGLVRRKVAVILTYGPQSTQAAREVTTTIPIVMARMDDADAHGFVANYSRPDANITGLSFQTGELSTKWIELLKEALPRGTRIAALWDATGTANQLRTIQEAARALQVDLHVVNWHSTEDFAVAFAAIEKAEAKGVVILASPLLSAQMPRLAELALAHGIAATYIYRAFAEVGGLISYGPLDSDPSFSRRRAAYFVDKLLKGAKVADLPIEQPTKFYLALNLKTAMPCATCGGGSI